MRKRANGEGSIRKRNNGTWEARITVGVNPETGKLISKSIYGRTQKELREKIKALEEKKEEQTDNPSAPLHPNPPVVSDMKAVSQEKEMTVGGMVGYLVKRLFSGCKTRNEYPL